jgi:hypothetical protein
MTTHERRQRRTMRAMSFAPLALGVVAAVANPTPPAGRHAFTGREDHAVVTRHTALYSGPSRTADRVGSVEEGVVVEVFNHGHRSGFVRVQTPGEDIGWISERNAAPVANAVVHPPSPVPSTEPVVSPALPTPHLNVATGSYGPLSCPVDGQPASTLNHQKNRATAPSDAEIDPSVTIDRLLAPGNDAQRFSEQRGGDFVAYVFHVKPGGPETVNCGDPDDLDTHIELVRAPGDDDKTRRVIVEITPRWRAAARAQGVDWSTETLQHQIQGHWVHVRGWMFYDKMHVGASENTKPGNANNFRATAWELHPLTSFSVVPHP